MSLAQWEQLPAIALIITYEYINLEKITWENMILENGPIVNFSCLKNRTNVRLLNFLLSIKKLV